MLSACVQFTDEDTSGKQAYINMQLLLHPTLKTTYRDLFHNLDNILYEDICAGTGFEILDNIPDDSIEIGAKMVTNSHQRQKEYDMPICVVRFTCSEEPSSTLDQEMSFMVDEILDYVEQSSLVWKTDIAENKSH